MKVTELVAERISDGGPIGFDELMEMALHARGLGFYETIGAAGRREGDFLTSVEVGPLFGALVARRLDTAWRSLGEPNPFTVVDAGAGRGTLARSVLDAEPDCAAAIQYVMVERSVELRTRQQAHLDLDPRVSARDDLPDESFAGVIVANELLDNLPTRLLERRPDGWVELAVDMADDGLGLAAREAPIGAVALADELAPGAALGSRIPWQEAAASWLRRAIDLVESGAIIVLDYADSTASLAARPSTEWLRTYRTHQRGGDPLEFLGHQDITCEVAVDQLTRVAAPDLDVTQSEWLHQHGLDELVEEGRRGWEDRAYIGDLAAVKARSRVTEAEALTDPTGLGAFRVLEWVL